MKKPYRNARRGNGYTTLDSVVGILFCAAVAYIAINLVLYMIGYGANDAAARDSARAAATADSSHVAAQAAVLACASHCTAGLGTVRPQIDMDTFHFADQVDSPVPLVSVTAFSNLQLTGDRFLSVSLPQEVLRARRTYVFPVLVLMRRPSVLEQVDIPALMPPGALPITDGSVPGMGDSSVGNASE